MEGVRFVVHPKLMQSVAVQVVKVLSIFIKFVF